jgi:hypothetical protein
MAAIGCFAALEARLELTHPQCENWSVQATETAYGREGVAATFRDRFETFQDFQVEPKDFIVCGDRILVPTRQRTRRKGVHVQGDRNLESEPAFAAQLTARPPARKLARRAGSMTDVPSGDVAVLSSREGRLP